MAYIGNRLADAYTSFAKQDFTTSATTSYTLDNPVANANEIALFINFVRQEPTTAYTASGTSLTLTSATSASDDMYCVFLGKAVQTVNPPNASVGTSQLVDGSVTSSKLGAGAILQVQSTTKTDTFNTTSTSFTDVTGLSVAITPSSTSSKVLINFSIGTHDLTGAGDFAYQIVRGSTAIGLGSGGGTSATVGGTINADRGESVAMTFLDTPSTTSATTYKIQVRTPSGTQMFINTRDGNSNYSTISTITVMEIKG